MPVTLSREDDLEQIRSLWKELGRRPTLGEYEARYKTCHKRLNKFGGYSELCAAVEETIEEFEADAIPDPDLPIDELLAIRKRQFALKQGYEEASKLRNVKVLLDGPIGLCHFGDPHLDDDGTDIGQLERDKEIVMKTRGMLACNVGDQSNNWCGRLARLYAEQSTSAEQAIQLLQWFIGGIDWLYLVAGNHDAWSGADSPIRWIKTIRSIHAPTSVRLNLCFPNGRQVRVNARHDFPGNSMWNPAHGPARAAQMGWRDHILTCGHKHIGGYNIIKDPNSGILSHAIRVASYKTYDRFAASKGFPDQNLSPCVVTIIDPYAKEEKGLVQLWLDLEHAADYLTYSRKEWKRSTGS